jgi:Molecular chaperone, HSP90 family
MMRDGEGFLNASQADTYIEKCFEIKCQEFKIGNHLINEWREDKKYYCSFTDTTVFDFQHYSMHDRSHSVNILHNIKMILGKERVEMLSVSDLWLLLESAYCHDIGMAITYEELCDIWEQSEFKEFVKKSMNSKSEDTRKIAYIYTKLDEIVRNRSEFVRAANADEPNEFIKEFDNLLDQECWAVIAQRYIMLLYTEFIRSRHTERSGGFIRGYGRKKDRSRMYEIVAQISILHGEEFEKVYSMVKQEDNGFSCDHMHPQFAAVMIRLGDLLDMDSNRFNTRMLNHMGMIPVESQLHIQKHKAMTHLSYTEEGISAVAKSEDFQVCKTVNQWFSWIEEETVHLICSWNLIVPKELYGCRMNKCDLKIYYKDELFDANKQTNFQADPVGIFEMLIGNNIYKTRLEFIREYLQNALDASKMKLWLWLKEQKSLLKMYPPEDITPFDINSDVYEQNRIEMEFKINWEKQEILFSIQDHGIGMEEKCISTLSVVAGNHWKSRKEYADEIEKMPVWLRPTGGFGIGIQSAFMLTDAVVFITKSEKEPRGKKIVIESKKKGGKVSEYSDSDAKNGTRVEVYINLGLFLRELQEKKKFFGLDERIERNIYDCQELPKVLLDIMERYISEMAIYSLIPVYLECDNEAERRVGMGWLPTPSVNLEKVGRNVVNSVKIGNESWNIKSFVYDDTMVLWDNKDYIMSILTLDGDINQSKCYYKGIIIRDEAIETNEPFSIETIYYGDNVTHYLSVSRDCFIGDMRNKHRKNLYILKILYASLFINYFNEFTDCENRQKEIKKVLTWYYLGVVSVNAGKLSKIKKQVSSENFFLIMDLDKKAAMRKAVKEAEIYKCEEIENIIFKNGFFKEEKKNMNEVLKDIREKECFFFAGADDDREFDIDMGLFRVDCRYIVDNYVNNGKNPEFNTESDEMIWKLTNENSYIVIDPEVCDVLNEYVNNYEHGRRVSYLKIKENGKLYLNIVCVEKKKGSRRNGTSKIGDDIKKTLKAALNQSVIFPIVICDSGEREDHYEEYPIWVTDVFADRYQNLLKEDVVSSIKTVNKKSYSYFLILPFTGKSWNRVMKEENEGGITYKKFCEIVKDPNELRLLYEWTYIYQIHKDRRLTIPQIQNEYDKLADSIYEWVFDDNSN